MKWMVKLFVYNLQDTFNETLRGDEKCAHEKKLAQQRGQSWLHCISFSQVTQKQFKREDQTLKDIMSQRQDLEMERVHQHAGQIIGVGGDQMMEHSGTALPTCYRIFYYYGDFSVTLSFAKTLKRESREK